MGAESSGVLGEQGIPRGHSGAWAVEARSGQLGFHVLRIKLGNAPNGARSARASRAMAPRTWIEEVKFATDSPLEGWRGVDSNFWFRNSHHAAQDQPF